MQDIDYSTISDLLIGDQRIENLQCCYGVGFCSPIRLRQCLVSGLSSCLLVAVFQVQKFVCLKLILFVLLFVLSSFLGLYCTEQQNALQGSVHWYSFCNGDQFLVAWARHFANDCGIGPEIGNDPPPDELPKRIPVTKGQRRSSCQSFCLCSNCSFACLFKCSSSGVM